MTALGHAHQLDHAPMTAVSTLKADIHRKGDLSGTCGAPRERSQTPSAFAHSICTGLIFSFVGPANQSLKRIIRTIRLHPRGPQGAAGFCFSGEPLHRFNRLARRDWRRAAVRSARSTGRRCPGWIISDLGVHLREVRSKSVNGHRQLDRYVR